MPASTPTPTNFDKKGLEIRRLALLKVAGHIIGSKANADGTTNTTPMRVLEYAKALDAELDKWMSE